MWEPPTCSCHSLCKSSLMKENSPCAPGACELELALKHSPKATIDFPEQTGGGPHGVCRLVGNRGEEKGEGLPSQQSFFVFSSYFFLDKASNALYWRHLLSLLLQISCLALSHGCLPPGSSIALLWSRAETALAPTAPDLSSPPERKATWSGTYPPSHPVSSPTPGTARQTGTSYAL